MMMVDIKILGSFHYGFPMPMTLNPTFTFSLPSALTYAGENNTWLNSMASTGTGVSMTLYCLYFMVCILSRFMVCILSR